MYQYLVNYPVIVDSEVELNDNQAIEKADHIFETSTIKPEVISVKQHFIVDFHDALMPSIVTDEEGFCMYFPDYTTAKKYADDNCQDGVCFPVD